jgi:hypothetical protein
MFGLSCHSLSLDNPCTCLLSLLNLNDNADGPCARQQQRPHQYHPRPRMNISQLRALVLLSLGLEPTS